MNADCCVYVRLRLCQIKGGYPVVRIGCWHEEVADVFFGSQLQHLSQVLNKWAMVKVAVAIEEHDMKNTSMKLVC